MRRRDHECGRDRWGGFEFGEDGLAAVSDPECRGGGSALVVDPIELLVVAQSSPTWRPALTRAA
jgi:hypothetical protein